MLTDERKLWKLVLSALENERCIDLHYRQLCVAGSVPSKIPNYKVMKQLVLSRRLGMFYVPLVYFYAMFITLSSLVKWVGSVFLSFFYFLAAPTSRYHAIVTTPNNIQLITAALESDDVSQSFKFEWDLLKLSKLSAGVGFLGVVSCIREHMKLLIYIFRMPGVERLDMILHARDAFVLLMLVSYVKKHPKHRFVTDDHYQRWAYLLSHTAQYFSIVQHGFLDRRIRFKNPFGVVRVLHVRDNSFIPDFEFYYQLLGTMTFSPHKELDDNPYASKAVFLASSAPWVQQEIELIKLIRAQIDVPIIVKFHPSHHYDERKKILSSMASYICNDIESPACKIFVSHSSFMEYDYSFLKIPTFSILRSGVDSTAKDILAYLQKNIN